MQVKKEELTNISGQNPPFSILSDLRRNIQKALHCIALRWMCVGSHLDVQEIAWRMFIEDSSNNIYKVYNTPLELRRYNAKTHRIPTLSTQHLTKKSRKWSSHTSSWLSSLSLISHSLRQFALPTSITAPLVYCKELLDWKMNLVWLTYLHLCQTGPKTLSMLRRILAASEAETRRNTSLSVVSWTVLPLWTTARTPVTGQHRQHMITV